MTDDSLTKLRQGFDAGTVSRDAYWAGARQIHQRLRDYFPLLADGAVEEIAIRNGELILTLRGGLRLSWDPDELRTAPSVLVNHGSYEAAELTVLLTVSRGAKVVFDIGANVGWYTINLARAIGPEGGRIVAFEPIPTTNATLERNIALNGVGNAVDVRRLGLGETSGVAEFFIPRVTGSVAASRRALFESEENLRVSATISTLDDVVREMNPERLDVIKCDIEGGELLMLRGGQETLRRFRPVLFLEMLRKWSRAYGYHPNDILALLDSLDYRCFAIDDFGLAEVSAIDESCVQTNFLFLQRSAHDGVREAVAAALASRGS